MVTRLSKILWMRWLLSELNVIQDGPTKLFCDNQAAKQISNNRVFHELTKHIAKDCYFVRERFETKQIIKKYISTTNQVADIFTKALNAEGLRSF